MRLWDGDGSNMEVSGSVRTQSTASYEWLMAAKEKAMLTKKKFEELRDAYKIENIMLQGWRAEVTGVFGATDIQLEFAKTWVKYFDAVIGSNTNIIETCQKAIDSSDPPDFEKYRGEIQEEVESRI